MFFTRLKPIDSAGPEGHASSGLKRTLSWPHLVALGVGAVVGTGIYTLIGTGAERAGPAVMLSFAIAGLVCVFAALCYAEMASSIPASGSAYTYTYSSLGEGLAWIIGWSLILEYTLVCAAVAVGWSGYVVGALSSWGFELPAALAAGPHAGGVFNLPAAIIVALVAGLLILGTRESAQLNTVLVAIKLIALATFVVIALPAFKGEHFTPFMPYGFEAHTVTQGGKVVERGVMSAAAIIFFAFYGFDAVSTAAEETKNPGRDLTIGILGSMAACTAIYMIVAAAAVGAMPFGDFATSKEPLAHIMRTLHAPEAAQLVGAAAIVALPSVILAFMFGQSRIFYVMARDGLLPRSLAKVDPERGSPVIMTLITAVVAGAVAGFLPLSEIGELANAGTLAAFIAVAVSVMALRIKKPDLTRPFKTPLVWIVAPLAIAGCGYLFFSLPHKTQEWFVIWNTIGIVVYLLFGAPNAVVGKTKTDEAA